MPLGTHIKSLVDDYHMVDKLQPVFSNSNSRNARYYIADNFLQAWLAVAKPAHESARPKLLERVLIPATRPLEVLEEFAFEKWIRGLHQEMSRKGLGDFELSELKLGYWKRSRDVSKAIEIDLVAYDEMGRRIRFGSCKRDAAAHDMLALARFDQHVEGFLALREHAHLRSWTRECVLLSPVFTLEQRSFLVSKGYACIDLHDYAKLMAPAAGEGRALNGLPEK